MFILRRYIWARYIMFALLLFSMVLLNSSTFFPFLLLQFLWAILGKAKSYHKMYEVNK